LASAMAVCFSGEHHHEPDAPAAAAMLPTLLHPDDVVLVKASNGVGLKLVCETLAATTPA
jgi:UDP-N-acetylmuramyl pentapeptide synthase